MVWEIFKLSMNPTLFKEATMHVLYIFIWKVSLFSDLAQFSWYALYSVVILNICRIKCVCFKHISLALT